MDNEEHIPHRPSSVLDTLRNGGAMQLRVVGALVLREMQTRYGREDIGYLWAVVEPVILLIMFLSLFYYHGRTDHHGMNLFSFLVTGIMTFLGLRKIVSSISGATDANKGLLLYPQVTPIDTMLARVVLEIATFIVVFCVIIGGGWLFGLASLPHDLLGVLAALFVTALLAVSLGLAQNAILTLFPLANRVLNPLWRFLFFTSCVFYNLRDLPLRAQEAILYNPIAHVIELLREAYFSNFESQVNDYSYPLEISAVCIFAGLLVERMFRYRTAAP